MERKCGRLEWRLDWNSPSVDFYLSLGGGQCGIGPCIALPAIHLGSFRLSKKWLAPLFRGVHSSLAPTARPGSYARNPLLRKAFCGFDAHVAKSDQSLRGLRPPNPRGFFDRLRRAARFSGGSPYGWRGAGRSAGGRRGRIARTKQGRGPLAPASAVAVEKVACATFSRFS